MRAPYCNSEDVRASIGVLYEKERKEMQKMGGKMNLLFSSTAIRAMEVRETKRERDRVKESVRV